MIEEVWERSIVPVLVRLHPHPRAVAGVRSRVVRPRAPGPGGRVAAGLGGGTRHRRRERRGRRARGPDAGHPRRGAARRRRAVRHGVRPARRHRAALRSPRQAAGDDRLARGARPVVARPGGPPPLRPGRRGRRLLDVRRADRHRGGPGVGWAPRPLRRADRGLRGVRQRRPARLRRGARPPARPGLARRLPGLGLWRLRASVDDHLLAGAGQRPPLGRGHDRGPPLRRLRRRRAVLVPDRPPAARPDRGPGQRRGAAARRLGGGAGRAAAAGGRGRRDPR